MSKKRSFFYFVFAISFLKLIFVAGNEIIAIPYDAEGYVRQAANHLFELGAPPGYPFWLAFSSLSGIPQRIAMELLLIGSSLILSGWLRKIFGEISGAIAFAMLVLSPATYFMFDYALSDGFYACLGIVAIAFSSATVFAQTKKAALSAAVLLGCSMGWMALARNEDPLLVVWAGLVVLLWILHSSKIESKRSVLLASKNAILVGAAIAFPAVVIVQTVNLVHLNKSGVFARTLAGLPGHTRLLHNLAEIDANEKNVRYVPISAKARSLAYMSSPTLAKYEKLVEDKNSIFHVVSRGVGLPPGEIGAGWIWHVFNSYVLQVNGVVGAELEYGKINAELEDGFNSGALKKRFVVHSFATAPVREILLHLPASAWEVAKKTFQTYPLGMDVGQEKELFDAVNLRRAALTGGGFKHTIQGWVFTEDPKKEIKSVISVAGSEQNPVTIAYMPRPDVEEGFKKNDWKPSVTGFKLSYYSSSEKVGGLLYLLQDGSTVVSDNISAGIQKVESQISHGLIVNQGVDFATVVPALRTGFRHRAQAYLSSIANSPNFSTILMVMLLGLGVLSVSLAKYVPERRFQISIFSFMVVALLALRVMFYAILESEAWGVEVRYMLTGNFMATILIAVWLPFCIGLIKKFVQDRAKVANAASN